MAKKKETARVISQECLAPGIYSMWIRTTIAADAVPGQFISIYSKDGSRLLPRPISLCEITEDALRVVYRVAGKGTDEFSKLQAGDDIDILGPLGNGFPLSEAAGKRVLLIGGGIGVPPMLETAKQLKDKADVTIVMGYRDSQMFLKKEFEAAGRMVVATDDGSYGTKGNVIDAIRVNSLEADVLFACGPKPMLRGLKAYAAENHVDAWISMEEKMACGIGACLACVCNSTDVDDHSHVKNKRICKDGPVFRAEEVEL